MPAGDILTSTTAPSQPGSNDGSGSGGSDNDDEEVDAGWGSWREASCRSGCTERGRGFRERRRVCTTGNKACKGAGYDVLLCDDTKVLNRFH